MLGKKSQIRLKVFSIGINIEVTQKCHGNTVFTFNITACDIRGHLTSSLEVQMACYVWTVEDVEQSFFNTRDQRQNSNNHV